jgi:CHAT domain-containing protein
VQGRNQVSRETVQAIRDGAIKQLAAALREQGRLVEAEIEGRRALIDTLGRLGRYNAQTADRLDDLARTILDQGRFGDAERLARAAIDIGVTIEARGSWGMAEAREALSSALVAQARWAEALANNQEMMRELGDDPPSRQRFGAGTLDWATALIKTGRGQEAVAMSERVLDSRRKSLGETHYATAEARAVQAMAFAASGERARALRAYQAALPILLEGAPRSTAETATARAQRLRLILDGYVRLLVEIRNTPVEAEARIDATAEAFRLADAARGQAVQQALAAASARATVTDPALADLARREQDASQQLAALEGVLTNALAAPADQQDARGIEPLRNDIDRLRQARSALVREIEQRFPDYAALINPQPATIERARQALRPGEALVATYVSADATFVWAVPQQGPVAFARASLSAVELGETVSRLRRSLDPRPQTIGDIPGFDVALANRLYQQLLQPVKPAWKGAASLLVVADGALAQLPLGVLVTEPKPAPAEAAGQALFAGYKQVPWLARRVAITQLPSVAALASLRALPAAAGARKPFIGFGDPWFSPQQATQIADLSAGETATRGGQRIRFRSAPATATLDSADLATLPRLPDTADEVRDIARALKADLDKDVFVGAAANERTVKTMALADRRVIAFATHGLVPGDLNGLTEPALALSAPQVANVEGDGLLTMDEVLGLKLNADWVVLSACNTAAGDGVGAEAVSGLGRAFFYAGARALLVSNWPVETTSARALTTDVFRRQADRPELTRADALRQAELALIDSDGLIDPATQKVAFSYAHPIFWAPFSLIGDGGGVTK